MEVQFLGKLRKKKDKIVSIPSKTFSLKNAVVVTATEICVCHCHNVQSLDGCMLEGEGLTGFTERFKRQKLVTFVFGGV